MSAIDPQNEVWGCVDILLSVGKGKASRPFPFYAITRNLKEIFSFLAITTTDISFVIGQ